MSASAHVGPRLAARLRRALDNAAPGGSIVDTVRWQVERDDLGDLLEVVEATLLSPAQARRLIELLSESAPAERSRIGASEWDVQMDGLVSELVSAGG